MHKRAVSAAEPSPWKLLLWTAVAGLIFGLIGFGEIAEDWLRVARNGFHKHDASGDIVLVKIDNKSLRTIGRWPWPRSTFARLTDELDQAGAERILFDLSFPGASNPADDRDFAQAIERSGKVVLAVRAKSGANSRLHDEVLPLPELSKGAALGTISVPYNYQNAVWNVPYSATLKGSKIPSYAALLAGADGGSEESFIPDYSVNIASIPTISATDILSGKVDQRRIRGKAMVIGWSTEILGDQMFLPGTGLMPAAYVHIIGAETLKSGRPQYLGWATTFLLSLLAAALAATRRRLNQQMAIFATAIAALIVVPVFLEARLISVDVTPGLFVLMTTAAALVWRRFKARGLINPVSSLPNLNALHSFRPGRKKALVAARLLNYEEALATLPQHSERKLAEQIVSRLTVGASDRTIYQGDGGIFAWFAEPREPFGNHLDALHALFRNPARIGKFSVDLAVSFGVEVGSARSLSSRLASALVAADDAARDGLKWRYHDPETLSNASWRLSMLSQLDDAIDKGEVWVAYQPKLDLATKRIIGAEALARWTHPEKGPIAASEFVAAAEQQNRIGKLTDFVLEQAVMHAAQLNRRNGDFEIAVNMSASLMNDRGFILRLSALLARHGLAPHHLTLELTETAALGSTGEGLEMISRLRDLGINISIDDYGTGLSTLDYLKRVPANEIKIDQSFVKGILENRSDRLMVQSTIELAHSLGRRVVAEGAELRETVDLLVEMGCDIAQGYAIGRPMSMESLTKRIATDRKRNAA